MKKVCVLGGGAWGTAFANLLAKNGCMVKLWCHEVNVVCQINTTNINQTFLPDITLSKNIQATTSLKDALQDAGYVFQAVPVQFLRSVLQSCKKFITKQQVLVSLSKGIENKTLLLPSQIVDDVFDFSPRKVAISGPSFAKDLATKCITSFDVASSDISLANNVAGLVKNDYCFPTVVDDFVGVQVGGACKNVLALLMGILDGAGCSDNTKVFIFMHCLEEIKLINNSFGAKEKTLYGLSGLGDIFLTCLGKHSRNLFVGRQIAQGKKIAEIIDDKNFVPEGINTTKSLYQFAQQNNLKVKIISATYEIIFEEKDFDISNFVK